ncbi:hypothetical protein TH63_08360 [Rufibacter radiotolerans]|uniref:Uncharacterized protein n=1 Tax=Rufibacter radiotolerans TaxID=1379910 RepID=A0A0H4W5H4_9BACT|nr:hypothetical protein [Rufibacter radiotolerans]AKQ45661.1 hypothetical protein TH63_08360 [Rufibacter radiotolerans]
MIHFTTISKNQREFNLIAIGSLAFKMYSRFLMDRTVQNCTQNTLNVVSVTRLPVLDPHKNNFYVALISDLDAPELYPLCDYLMKARINFGYTVGEVMALNDSPTYLKRIHKLKNSFDVLVELENFLVVDSRELNKQEKHAFLSTNFTLQLLCMLKQVCQTEFSVAAKTTTSTAQTFHFGGRTSYTSRLPFL